MTSKSYLMEMPSDKFRKVIEESESYKEALQKIGYSKNGNNIKKLKNRIQDEGIDVTHIEKMKKEKQLSGLKMMHEKRKTPLSEILVKESTYSTTHLRDRLIKEGILEEKCEKCGVGKEWQGEPLTLQLDHKNGINNDHRLENLRLLCPNCHTQTETHSGKNKKILKRCEECNKKLYRKNQSNLCQKCHNSIIDKSTPQRKVDRPSKEELLKLILTKPFTTIAEEFGVSDNAIRKWCKYYGLPHRKKDIESYHEKTKTLSI